MKKHTTKILIGGLAIVALIVMATVATPYFFKDQFAITSVPSTSKSDWKELQLKNFSKIMVSGSWEVQIRQGTVYSVKVLAPVAMIDTSCVVKNDELVINKLAANVNPTPRIEITMPNLQSIHILGAAQVLVGDFDAENKDFNLTVEGATSFHGERLKYDSVNITCLGASSIKFTGCSLNSAAVNVSGASNVELERMTGGELTGELNGVASLRYGGNISANKIKTSGLAVVKQEN